MATTYITISDGSRLGQQARNAAATLQSAKEQLADHLAIMVSQIDGSDYSQLEQQYGLQAGQGATLYALVNNVSTLLATSFDANALIARLG